MKKLLIAGMSAACIAFGSPVSAANMVVVYTHNYDVPVGGRVHESLWDDRNSGGDAMCALTGMSGHFAGGGENALIFKKDHLWSILANAGQPGVSFNVTCWQAQ
jgi:hypothetical protein